MHYVVFYHIYFLCNWLRMNDTEGLRANTAFGLRPTIACSVLAACLRKSSFETWVSGFVHSWKEQGWWACNGGVPFHVFSVEWLFPYNLKSSNLHGTNVQPFNYYTYYPGQLWVKWSTWLHGMHYPAAVCCHTLSRMRKGTWKRWEPWLNKMAVPGVFGTKCSSH